LREINLLAGKRIVVVMPAFNGGKTLEITYRMIPFDVVDDVLLVDDCSHDDTREIANRLGIKLFCHSQNMGYGSNQKTCYFEALKLSSDIIVMIHPDYQYSPKFIPSIASLVAFGEYDVALGSRLMGGKALQNGMPVYKYLANRILTKIQNFFLGVKLSDYHTGFRAFNRNLLEMLPLRENSDDFVFDNQILAQAIFFNYSIGEVPCSCKYFPEASSINFTRSVRYGLEVLLTTLKYFLQKRGWMNFRIFSIVGRRLYPAAPSDLEHIIKS
jgi:glycosyltransferase involved in cell wall biosynthesis